MTSYLPDPVRVRALFDDAADLAPDQRDAFLADACAGDAALEGEVLALLACLNGPTLDAPPPAGMPAPVPELIGRFAVLGKLGEGGMGIVFRARDHALDRDVALKLVNHGGGDEGRVRLLREAQAMARVAHPNVVPVYEVGVHHEQVFIAMELVRGTTLSAWRRAQPRTWREVLRVLIDAGRGLAAAHRAGLLHRDVKPDNVLIGDDGRARIVDFGLARASAAPATGSRKARATPGDLALALTHDGAVVGSPGFMSPEHFVGTVDAAADQWSLAATAYHALFGRLPFLGRDVLEMREAVLTGTPPLPPPGDVPRAVIDAVMRGLARRPEARFASIEAFLDVLAAELAVDPEHDPKRFRRQRRGLAITIAAAGALGVLLAGARSHLTFALPMRWLFGQSLIGLVILIAIIVGFRRALWATVHDRRVMSLVLVAVSAIAVHRALAFDAPVTLVLRTDAIISISLLVVGAITVERWLALSAAVMTAFLLGSLAIPAITVPGFHPTLVSTIALGVWFWREPRG